MAFLARCHSTYHDIFNIKFIETVSFLVTRQTKRPKDHKIHDNAAAHVSTYSTHHSGYIRKARAG